MVAFARTRADASVSPFNASLRGNNREPSWFAEDIHAEMATANGDNDLKSVLAAIFVKIAEHNSDGTTEASIESHIALALDYNLWKGAWIVNTRYTVGQEVKNGSNYYRRLQAGISGSGDEPTQTTTTWLQLSGLDLEIAEFHEAIVAHLARTTALEAALPGKANAADLTALTGRVTAAEGVNTTQEAEIEKISDDFDGLEIDIQNQIRAFASHQEIVVHELPDPTIDLAPEYAYLSNLWKPSQGFDGHKAPIPYSPGEYWNTSGTANRAKFRFSSTTVDIDGTVRTMRGFFQRAERLQHHGLPIVSFGEALNNPVGGAVAGIYFGRDPGNPLGLAQSWQCWVKTTLVRPSENPWNLPRAPESAQFIARVHYGTNQHFDLPFGRTITRTVDGVEYTQSNCGANPQPGAAWINALDLSSDAASTVEVEFRKADNSATLWLGNQAKAWTWVDPADNPTAVARIDKIQRATMWQGELLASLSRSGTGSLDEIGWSIEAGLTGITTDAGTSDGSWSKYLYLDCDAFAQALTGSHGVVVVVERAGAIVGSVFIPWSMFSVDWANDHEFFAGKWDTGGAGDHKVMWASVGVNSNRFHLRLACSHADGDSTVRIYRNN